VIQKCDTLVEAVMAIYRRVAKMVDELIGAFGT
jgi:hypothetical protein